MSTFAKPSFNAAVYSASRPTYPVKLFEHIFAFHREHSGQWKRAVDLGCGTGQATIQLQQFDEIIGIDPSAGMVEKARVSIARNQAVDAQKFTFKQGSAEDLSTAIPKDNSVDLLIAAAQSAHWFDWEKVWKEAHRILSPGGTIAFWIYAEIRLPQYPSLGQKITTFAQGTDVLTSLGLHFQRPGRTILERHLVDVPEPSTVLGHLGLQNLRRVYFCGDEQPEFLPEDGLRYPVIMQNEMRWLDLLGYFRTWSSLHTYHEHYPEDLSREDDARFLEEDLAACTENPDDVRGGNIAIRFWKDLREGALNAEPGTPVGVQDPVKVEWPIALLLTSKS
ncbi:hypothetical protein CVT24_000970 [Panaeolus cyanescens]|uniref:Methyltransferase type 11 domain-containing protein n=1 Tax=Panaeolus cyanescens TaxID=181874 RepID=A0A409YCE9_9AGAR|nr:hypothetical protein CVT24_000970 [Panaeolus cyanescens]